jgi:hypothetical protein
MPKLKLKRDGDRYIVISAGERIGFVRRDGAKWGAVDTYVESSRDFPTRAAAVEWLTEKAMTLRPVTNDDMWSAIRGLGMARMSYDGLRQLADAHRGNPLFASRVITAAADQYAAFRTARDAADRKPRRR